MKIPDLIAEINAEIARLEEAKLLLLGAQSRPARKPVTAKKRSLSSEARARIAAAQKKRWATAKKAKA